MSRIKACFTGLAERKAKALVTYITAGDPEPAVTVPALHAMVEAGANMIEIGVPFSDPMADGPVIQAACERALEHHVTLHNVLDMVRVFRESDDGTPVVLMGYLNPIEVWGYEGFAEAAAAAGVDGVLTVDMPPEEAVELTGVLNARGMDAIFLLAPTSDESRIRSVCNAASGFVYYVSLKGVTGANRLDTSSVAEKIAEIRRYTDIPLGVGFGIRDPESAAQVAEIADAVVVGSVLVSRMAELKDSPDSIPGALAEIVSGLRKAMDAAA